MLILMLPHQSLPLLFTAFYTLLFFVAIPIIRSSSRYFSITSIIFPLCFELLSLLPTFPVRKINEVTYPDTTLSFTRDRMRKDILPNFQTNVLYKPLFPLLNFGFPQHGSISFLQHHEMSRASILPATCYSEATACQRNTHRAAEKPETSASAGSTYHNPSLF